MAMVLSLSLTCQIGATRIAARLITWGRFTLESLSNTPKFLQESTLLEEGGRAIELVKNGGYILVVIGVLVDAGLLVADAIRGGKQREELREYASSMSAARSIVIHIQVL